MSTELPRELGEDQVRDLLHHAARTVDVGPAAPLVDTARPPRRWVPAALVAAALVVAAAVTGLVLTRADRQVEPATDTLPPVLGLYGEEAATRLQAAGFRVRSELVPDPGCLPAGAALGADLDGREATLRINQGPNGCPSPEPSVSDTAWRFLGTFSEGPGTPLADEVSLRVDGAPATALTPDQVGDPDAWGEPAAGALRAALDDPDLQVRWTSRVDCADPLPDITGDGFFLVRPDDPCGTRVDLAVDGTGEVSGIDVTTSGADASAAMPDVRGLPEDQARAAVATVDPAEVYVTYLEGACAEPLAVTAQSPRPGRLLRPQDAVVLTVVTDRAACTKPARDGAVEQQVGQQLIDFAGGGPAPAFADRVRLFVGRAPAGTLTGEEATDLDRWRGCPAPSTGYTSEGCPLPILSGLTDAGAGSSDVAVRADPVESPCGSWLAQAHLSTRVTADDSFFLSPPAEEISCLTGFRLQVFLDDQQRITAVDLAQVQP